MLDRLENSHPFIAPHEIVELPEAHAELLQSTVNAIQCLIPALQSEGLQIEEHIGVLRFDDRLYNPAEATLKDYFFHTTVERGGRVSSTVYGHRFCILNPENMHESLNISVYPLRSSDKIQIMVNASGYCRTITEEEPPHETFWEELSEIIGAWRNNTFRRTFRLGNRVYRR